MLSDRILAMRNRVRDRSYKIIRNGEVPDIISEGIKNNLPLIKRAALLTTQMCRAEKAVIYEDEKIVFTRTVPGVPNLYDESERWKFFGNRFNPSICPVGNVSPDFNILLQKGLLGLRNEAEMLYQKSGSNPDFLHSAVEVINSVLELSKRYAELAGSMGKNEVAQVLDKVPAYPASTLHEALQSVKFIHSMLWLSGHLLVGLGRFDQYMYPYYKKDIESGILSENEARELIAEFFISVNKDSDLYRGIQQGDNGQTIMLGGVTRDGASAINPLTYAVLEIASELQLIDPKINLRVDSDTPANLLETAVKLTRKGLGFPQYSNDEIVIPGLVKAGYDLEDARDYSVAACWEFVIPGRSMDWVNIGAVSFPSAVDNAVRKGLRAGDSVEIIMKRIKDNIAAQVKRQITHKKNAAIVPAPLFSLFYHGTLEFGRDISDGVKYRNLGIHGAGSANAADALSAVKKLVFEEGSVSPNEYLAALKNNFENCDHLREKIDLCPKVGNNDSYADDVLSFLFDVFAEACNTITSKNKKGFKVRNSKGYYDQAFVRPGSGSAMYYTWLTRGAPFNIIEPVLEATADGRKKGDFISSSLAPSPGVKVNGPISVLKSFAKIHYDRIINGGPITMELSDSVFRNIESIQKVADMIRLFVKFGCQQLQLNTLNADLLEDARLFPEKYKNLIVRVWGWSGYFSELSPEYQEQIILRHKYNFN